MLQGYIPGKPPRREDDSDQSTSLGRAKRVLSFILDWNDPPTPPHPHNPVVTPMDTNHAPGAGTQ
ncbi:hypothetical protein PROFUN_10355 [Planoprotostelium fungivorum]|uniref:Uncharacterized protein n=1 Tax=Planoprotostelium fungivorum TaxID=1890364 RepID=A0A2P6NDW5_9EUKA|nr:hypothetical protein PROFUN_10355 [Planoprotostelium fungivorum]